MKTFLSLENPFLHSIRLEQAYVWERLLILSRSRGPLRILDYGTYDGAMLQSLAPSGFIREAVGVDVNADALNSRPMGCDLVTLHAVLKGKPLPFPDHSFDVVTLIGVLEHIHRQDLILAELHRVLKKDGRLLVSVPGKHTFSFLDLGNLKFRFPRTHRCYYTLRHGQQDYIRRYVNGENGLIGDIEAEKRWHEHFSQSGLAELLANADFRILDEDGFGKYFRVIHNFHYLSPIFKRQLHSLMLRDMQKFEGAEIFVECEKSRSAVSM